MYQRSLRFLGFAALVVLCTGIAPVKAADEYAVDAVHSSVSFRVSHLGLAWIYGRFNSFSGSFTIDPDASRCAFNVSIKSQSVDTNNAGRDNHLRGADFFNAKQFPAIEFKSTSVKPGKDGYEVTGDVTMHGVTKPITVALVGGRTANFPPGTQRTGYSAEFVLKRADFGMDKMLNAIGDEVHVGVGLEGTMKK